MGFSFSVNLLSFAILCGISFSHSLKDGGKHWALLVAGSNGFENYRHQADVCHAYHVLKDHGFPEENIIVMMYDDIAYNTENKDKGVIINRPNGENVYQGVKIDYKGKDVTPEVFLNVLQGKKEQRGSKRVIDSGPNDHIFVNFVDHGAPGLVAFPDDSLHARELMTALKKMHKKKRFAQMVLYVEACESGSMFNKILPNNINIYATTAANAKESSYACYLDKHLDTYLGDLYSVNWMENSDVANLKKETLLNQFDIVRKNTNKSHVMEYGDMDIASEPVSDFQGDTPSARNVYYPALPFDAVPSHDVDLHILRHKIQSSTIEEERSNLSRQLDYKFKVRSEIASQMHKIAAAAVGHDSGLFSEAISIRTEDINFDCYEPAVKYYSAMCRNINQVPFALRVLYILQNVCNIQGMSSEILIRAMDDIC